MRELRFKVAEGESPKIVALVRKLGIDRVEVHREWVPGPDRTDELSLALMIASSAAMFWVIRFQKRERSQRMTLAPSALAR